MDLAGVGADEVARLGLECDEDAVARDRGSAALIVRWCTAGTDAFEPGLAGPPVSDVDLVPDALVAEVEDNGRGFQMNPQGMPSRVRGLGLLGIRERVAVAGGSLTVDSAPGRGTKISLRIPLAPVEKEAIA